MPLQKLSLENLKDLDAGGVLAIDGLITRVANDVMDRPFDATARVVTIQLKFEPVVEQDGRCDEVKIQVIGKAAVPDYKTKLRSLGARKTQAGGMFVFNPDSPDNVNQRTLIGDDES
jgi:hypothetical protein